MNMFPVVLAVLQSLTDSPRKVPVTQSFDFYLRWAALETVLSVSLSFSVSVTPFFYQISYRWIFMKLTPYIDRMKCLWHESFEVFVMSAQWLPPYLTESLRNLRTCNTWRGNMLRTILKTKCKNQDHTGRFRFWPSPPRGFIFIWPNHFIFGIHTTHGGAKCWASCSRWNVKCQGHTGRFKFWPCPLSGLLLIWPHHFICGIHTTHEMRGDISRTIFKTKCQGSRSHGSF